MVILGRQLTSIVAGVTLSVITNKQCNDVMYNNNCHFISLPYFSLLLYSEVDLTEDSSVMPPLLPQIVIPSDSLNHSFFLPVVSNGNPVSWQLGSPLEYYSADAGTPQGITIQQLSGMITVDTQYITPGQYSVQIVFTDLFTELKVSIYLKLSNFSNTLILMILAIALIIANFNMC